MSGEHPADSQSSYGGFLRQAVQRSTLVVRVTCAHPEDGYPEVEVSKIYSDDGYFFPVSDQVVVYNGSKKLGALQQTSFGLGKRDARTWWITCNLCRVAVEIRDAKLHHLVGGLLAIRPELPLPVGVSLLHLQRALTT